MAQQRNPSITQWVQRIFGFTTGDMISNEVGNVIVPVVEICPVSNVVRSAGMVNGTSATVFVTPSDKDFYITGIALNFIKDATAAATIVEFNATIDGVSRALSSIRTLATTADSKAITHSFETPVKIDRNTNITVDTDSATANISVRGTVIGYTVEKVSAAVQ